MVAILVTGTPGVGKSETSRNLAQTARMYHIELSRVISQTPALQASYDDERECWVAEEDAVGDWLENELESHSEGVVVDTHVLIDYFPQRWFSQVFVLTCDNTLLYDRLAKRGYPPEKITENVESEIMRVILDEATDSYENVQVLTSNTVEDLENNVAKMLAALGK